MRDATLVTTPEQLDTAVFRLQGARRLAIDTEFMRERTYFPQLCLVQVASDADCYLVDPLAGLDLGPLLAALADRAKPKVLHAARQDLEVLLNVGGLVPGPVFDTQVAAAMLGMPPQVGYAELVARQLGHSIDKGQTRTDWSRRRLSDAQLAYAADDVHHLLQLHTDLAVALQEKDRGHWHAEECAALEDPALYRTEPASAWRRLKGLGRLHPAEQAVARALAGWRDTRWRRPLRRRSRNWNRSAHCRPPRCASAETNCSSWFALPGTPTATASRLQYRSARRRSRCAASGRCNNACATWLRASASVPKCWPPAVTLRAWCSVRPSSRRCSAAGAAR
jgi:ribonuclease D